MGDADIDRTRVGELIDRFIVQAMAGGVEIDVLDDLCSAAPPSGELAPLLLGLVLRTTGRARFAVASAAVRLASDAGYRPVVETVLLEYRLEAAFTDSFLRAGTYLDGEALHWWLGVVDTLPSTAGPVDYALYQRRDIVLEHHRDLVAQHLLRTDSGPGRYAADVAAELLRRTGPLPPIEEMFARWIRDGRFDGRNDADDGSTSAQILAMCLEDCVTDGPFTLAWPLVGEAVEHWRQLLADPGRRSGGLRCLVSLLRFKTSLAGALPSGLDGVLPADGPEWAAIERGFSGINAGKRGVQDVGPFTSQVDGARRELDALASP